MASCAFSVYLLMFISASRFPLPAVPLPALVISLLLPGSRSSWKLEAGSWELFVQFRQRLEMLALFLRQRPRELNFHRGVEVAAVVRFPDGRHAVAFEPKHLPALGRLRDLEPDRARNRRDLRLAAEHGGGDRHRDFGV